MVLSTLVDFILIRILCPLVLLGLTRVTQADNFIPVIQGYYLFFPSSNSHRMVIPFIHNHLGKQFFYLFFIFLGKYFDATLIVNHIDYYLGVCLTCTRTCVTALALI